MQANVIDTWSTYTFADLATSMLCNVFIQFVYKSLTTLSILTKVFREDSLFFIKKQLGDTFPYTNSFGRDGYGALMKRRQKFIDINYSGLLAGVELIVFGVLLLAIISLLAMSYINEVLQNSCKRNTLWEIANSLMPSNTTSLKYQLGWTRRILIVTCGFTVLLSTTYYQSNLLQQLMIPTQAPRVTLDDIISDIDNFRAKAYFDDAVLSLMDSPKLSALRAALAINVPVIDTSSDEIIDKIKYKDAILIEELASINYRLSKLQATECAHYVVVELKDMSTYWLALILRQNRRETLESLNVIVAERMDFVTKLVQEIQMSDECRKYIYPPNSPEPRYVALSIYTISGYFALIICLFIISTLTLLSEIFINRYIHHADVATPKNIADRLDVVISDTFIDNINDEDVDDVLNYYYAFRDKLLLCQKI
jgi:hypothetical protein